jgi:UrcA family protein
LNDASNIRIADSVAWTKIADIETHKWLQETRMFTTARNELFAMVAILATSAAFCGPARAESADPEVPSVAVHYGDLDLTSDAGIKVLYQRLRVAAKQVCSAFTGFQIKDVMQRRACYKESLSDAVTKVNLEMLSVLHKNANARPRVS